MRFGRGTKAEGRAEVVATFSASRAGLDVSAGNAAFDGHAHAHTQRGYAWTESSDDCGRFMAENERVSKGKGAVATMGVVVYCKSDGQPKRR